MEKFNYQVVIKVSDDVRIIFAGVTQHRIAEVISSCNSVLKDGLDPILFEGSICENLVYQPVKPVSDESKA